MRSQSDGPLGIPGPVPLDRGPRLLICQLGAGELATVSSSRNRGKPLPGTGISRLWSHRSATSSRVGRRRSLPRPPRLRRGRPTDGRPTGGRAGVGARRPEAGKLQLIVPYTSMSHSPCRCRGRQRALRVQVPEQAARAEDGQPRRGDLQSQRKPVEPSSDLGNVRGIHLGHLESGIDGADPVGEQRTDSTLASTSTVSVRYREPRVVPPDNGAHPRAQRPSRSDQQAEPGGVVANAAIASTAPGRCSRLSRTSRNSAPSRWSATRPRDLVQGPRRYPRRTNRSRHQLRLTHTGQGHEGRSVRIAILGRRTTARPNGSYLIRRVR